MPKVKLAHPYKYEGKQYGVGDVIRVDAVTARRLYALGNADRSYQEEPERAPEPVTPTERSDQPADSKSEKQPADKQAAESKSDGKK